MMDQRCTTNGILTNILFFFARPTSFNFSFKFRVSLSYIWKNVRVHEFSSNTYRIISTYMHLVLFQ